MDLGLSSRTRWRCLLRSSMLNMGYNTHGLQSVGFLYAILPGLRELHPDDENFAQSCARYSKHFNCHVLWSPFLCGAFLHTERQIAQGMINPEMVHMLKDTALNSLSAVGDSFISGSLMPCLMLILACLALLGSPHIIWIILLIGIVLSLILKLSSFYLGLARGFNLLSVVRRLNLINRSDHLKIFNGILLTAFLALALNYPPEPLGFDLGLPQALHIWFLPIGVMMLLSYTVARLHLSRSIALATMILVTSIFF